MQERPKRITFLAWNPRASDPRSRAEADIFAEACSSLRPSAGNILPSKYLRASEQKEKLSRAQLPQRRLDPLSILPFQELLCALLLFVSPFPLATPSAPLETLASHVKHEMPDRNQNLRRTNAPNPVALWDIRGYGRSQGVPAFCLCSELFFPEPLTLLPVCPFLLPL